MPPPSKPESLDFLLAQVCRLHHKRARALLERVGLYRGQPRMLHLLWDQDGCTHSKMAVALHVSPATITRMVQRLERAGFVKRRSDPSDQRISRVYLTAEGRGVQASVIDIWRRLEQETVAGLTIEEQHLLRRFLSHIGDNLLQVTAQEPRF